MRKGFTLIELLVVIAIIGILSSVMLIALNSARGRARDARVISSISQIRSLAEIYYDSANASYAELDCGNDDMTGTDCPDDVKSLRNDIVDQGGTNFTIKTCSEVSDVSGAYCSQVDLPGTNRSFCIDSAGQSGTNNVSCDTSVCTCE